MSLLASKRDPGESGVYRLDRFDVEVRGRWREFGRSVLLLLLLFLMQQPLRSEALKDPGTTLYIEPVVSLRISLILDLVFIVVYFMVAHRAWGLVRTFRAPPRPTKIVQVIACYLIPLLCVVDLAENIYLWLTYTDAGAVTSLSWGPSHNVLVFGVGVALGVSVLLALVTDPRLYWQRLGGEPSRRFEPSHRFERLSAACLSWCASKLSWCASKEDIERWKRALDPPTDDGSCRCGDTFRPSPLVPAERDWGVICCSGGGVRSAAFSLGGLQTLDSHNLYDKANAVVGVSGGGYTSTAFHVMRWQSGDTPEQSVAHDKTWSLPAQSAFTPQSPELQWLRRHTHYVLDSMRVAFQGALSLAFGIAVNLVLLAVAIGATAWFLGWLYLASGTVTLPSAEFADLSDQGSSIQLDVGGDWWWLQHLWWWPVAGLGLFLLERAWDRVRTIPHSWRERLRQVSTWLVTGGILLCLFLLGLPALITALFDYADTSGSTYAGLIYSLGIVPQERCEAVLLAQGAVACGVNNSPETGTPGIAAASIVTVVTSILAVLASFKAASKSSSDGSGFSGFFQRAWSKIKDPVVPWVAASLIVLVCLVQLIRWTAVLTTQPDRLDDWRYAFYAAIVLILLKVFSDPNRTSLHPFFRERISYAFFVRRRYRKIESLPYSEPLRFSRSRPPVNRGPRLVTCAVANASDATLVPSQRGCTPFVFDDEAIGLTDRLLPPEAARRDSATYEFAADFGHRDATIPAAVAMSAAAFSPLAGRENVRLGPYRAVLALGNARLGVWLPNPLWVDAVKIAVRQAKLQDEDFAKTWSRLSCEDAKEVWGKLKGLKTWARDACKKATPAVEPRHADLWGPGKHLGGRQGHKRLAKVVEMSSTVFKKPGTTRILREAVGKASIYDRFLYVTDGGHYDNLGLIEALRRKPRRIFVIDASNDPEDTFRALGVAVATARMDLDCELQMDPRPMRRLEERRSAAAWCTGVANFADGSTCAVFLVKAVMLDEMPWDVETYAASNLGFPRTSTGKQLYSEFDFEAYRMLGLRAVEELLASPEYLRLDAKVGYDETAGT